MDVTRFLDFLQANQALVPYVAAILSAAETTVILSIFVPATVILTGTGALVVTGALKFLPLWIGATVGSVIGSTASYLLGRRFGPLILSLRVFRRYGHRVDRARRYFRERGDATVVFGHFLGPVRPFIFLVAGISHLPLPRFLAMTAVGSAVWALAILKIGEIGGNLFGWIWSLFSG